MTVIKLLLNTVGFLGFGPRLDRVFTVNLMSVTVCGFLTFGLPRGFLFFLYGFGFPWSIMRHNYGNVQRLWDKDLLNTVLSNNTRHLLELRRVFCCESPGRLCHVQVKFTEQKSSNQSSYFLTL